MKVSVVIPVYNVMPYLERCVNSVLSQTYKNLEIILVDDGSTDGSGELCDKLSTRDSRIRVIHQKNQGLSCARNTGIQYATGKYVIFLDSDDEWLLSDGLHQIVQSVDAQTEMVAFKIVHFYNGQPNLSDDYDIKNINQIPNATEVFAHLVYSQQFNMSACPLMVSKELLTEHKIYFPIGMISEDVFWSMHLWQCLQKVKFINLDFYGYHHREASISTMGGIRVFDSYDQIFSYWKAQCDEGCKNAQIIRAYMANLWVNRGYAYNALANCDKPKALHILQKHKDILEYGHSPKSKRVRNMIKFGGIKITVRILGWYWYMRNHIKH